MASREAWSLGPGQPNVAKRQCNFSRWLLSLDIFERRVSRLERERVQQLTFWRLDVRWCADVIFVGWEIGRCQACIIYDELTLTITLRPNIVGIRWYATSGILWMKWTLLQNSCLQNPTRKSYFSAPKPRWSRGVQIAVNLPVTTLVVSFSAQLQMAGPSLHEANQRFAFGWERMQGMPGFSILCRGTQKQLKQTLWWTHGCNLYGEHMALSALSSVWSFPGCNMKYTVSKLWECLIARYLHPIFVRTIILSIIPFIYIRVLICEL